MYYKHVTTDENKGRKKSVDKYIKFYEWVKKTTSKGSVRTPTYFNVIQNSSRVSTTQRIQKHKIQVLTKRYWKFKLPFEQTYILGTKRKRKWCENFLRWEQNETYTLKFSDYVSLINGKHTIISQKECPEIKEIETLDYRRIL